MRVRVEGCGSLASVIGEGRVWVGEGEGEVTVARVLDELAEQIPALIERLPQTACAIGDALARRRDGLRDGDTLVLLPPVAGG